MPKAIENFEEYLSKNLVKVIKPAVKKEDLAELTEGKSFVNDDGKFTVDKLSKVTVSFDEEVGVMIELQFKVTNAEGEKAMYTYNNHDGSIEED